VEGHPELSGPIKDGLLKGQVVLGMSPEAVGLIWGDPERKSHTVGVEAIEDVWWYGGTRLFFRDGVLISSQTDEAK